MDARAGCECGPVLWGRGGAATMMISESPPLDPMDAADGARERNGFGIAAAGASGQEYTPYE